MEKDFQAAPKRFWKTVCRLRRGKRGTIQAVYSGDGTVLTLTEEVIGRWKEYFGDLLNPTQPPSVMETELEDDGVSSPISLGEVTVVVKQLHSGKAPGIDEIPPEMLKALGVEGLSWLTRLFNIAWGSGSVPKEWQTVVVPGKVYSKVLERRVRPIVEPQI